MHMLLFLSQRVGVRNRIIMLTGLKLSLRFSDSLGASGIFVYWVK